MQEREDSMSVVEPNLEAVLFFVDSNGKLLSWVFGMVRENRDISFDDLAAKCCLTEKELRGFLGKCDFFNLIISVGRAG
jgi:hypothetical protein